MDDREEKRGKEWGKLIGKENVTKLIERGRGNKDQIRK